MSISQNKYAQHAASGFRKAQKRGYKGEILAWLEVFYPTMARDILPLVEEKIRRYEGQSAQFTRT